MDNKKIKEIYAKLYAIFGFNTYGFLKDYTYREDRYTKYRFSSIEEPYLFRKELIKAIQFCIENGHYDIMHQDNVIHAKHELFFERLRDEKYTPYQALRNDGFYDEDDFLMCLDDTDKIVVKSYETREILVNDKDTAVFYEYNPTISGIPVYIKVVFERHCLYVDIHTNNENVVDAFSN